MCVKLLQSCLYVCVCGGCVCVCVKLLQSCLWGVCVCACEAASVVSDSL